MTEPRDRKLLVFGNGPSLRGFDFERTGAVDTLGMNAAYRYWDKIGWYPTHYCCVDDQLVETHHVEIFRLIETGQVTTVFTLAKILEFQPEMANMEGVYFREQFHGTLAKRLKGLGSDKPHVRHPAFIPSNPKKLTTGAFAVRYGLYQGYREIGLMGIDLDYVEILPEARAGDGLQLEIAETVTANPNYFFDDYQRKGDRYNIPNPAEHDGNLHVQAFEVLRDDLAIQSIDAAVTNLNPASRLHDLGIFPSERPESFLSEAGIGAIAVPTTEFEVDDICQNIRLWDMPAYHPVLQPNAYGRCDLVFIFSKAPTPAIKTQILAAWDETRFLKQMFRGGAPVFLSADLSEEVDTYQREYVTQPGEAGFKSGPNLQFFASMAQLGAHYRDFIFFMETDCAPVRPGWLTALDAQARGDVESWVIGSHYRGVAKITRRFFMHLNGNALYRVGDKEFRAFLSDVWQPLLMDTIATEDPRAAYDCILSRHWSLADSHERNPAWESYRAYGHRFRATGAIVNISGADDLSSCEGQPIQDTLQSHPEAVVIHGRQYAHGLHEFIGETWVSPGTKRLSAISGARETRAPEFVPNQPPSYVLMPEGRATKLSDTRFRLEGRDGEDGRVLIIFDTRIDVEDVYTLTLRLETSEPCEAALVLCRHGTGDYDGTSMAVTLEAGENTLVISHTFPRAHARLRAQVSVAAQPVEIDIKSVDLALAYSWWPSGMESLLAPAPGQEGA
ncbi:MAG: hypothetical protein AAF253_05475 [Pseudomonadota bacterium]